MERDKSCYFKSEGMSLLATRRTAIGFIGLFFFMPLVACGQGEEKLKKDMVLNVEMFSYVDQGTVNISFNGTGLGVMGRYGGTGTIVGVRVPFGIQKLKWKIDGPKGTPRTGEVVTVKNQLVIYPGQIPDQTRYLGLHLYPDDTVEITFSESIPERTSRGMALLPAEMK